MRLFGSVDGSVDRLDRPFLFGLPFTLAFDTSQWADPTCTITTGVTMASNSISAGLTMASSSLATDIIMPANSAAEDVGMGCGNQ